MRSASRIEGRFNKNSGWIGGRSLENLTRCLEKFMIELSRAVAENSLFDLLVFNIILLIYWHS